MEQKSITEELRKYVDGCDELIFSPIVRRTFIAIAAHIDAEHEKVCSDAYAEGVMSVSIALDESAYIELPKDIDGEYIHIGDVVDCGESTFKVNELRLTKAGWNVGDCRHHKPTVEELLEEMYDALDDARIPNGSEKRTYEEIIAEYAQKLQLRKETE